MCIIVSLVSRIAGALTVHLFSRTCSTNQPIEIVFDGCWHHLFGDPAPGVPKQIVIVLSNGVEYVKGDFEGMTLVLPASVTVQSARYHTVDVTEAMLEVIAERVRAQRDAEVRLSLPC